MNTETNTNQETLLEENNTQETAKKPFWKRIVEIGEKVPIEEWEKLPKDFARNAEHYMYGAPREEDYPE